MAKIGRNDPCPCGSGKKYKKCCQDQSVAQPVDDVWHTLRAVDDRLAHQLLKHAKRLYGYEGLYEAWEDFSGGQVGEFDPNSPHNQAFFPWYLYNWTPETEGIEADTSSAPTIAQSYLDRYRKRLSALDIRFLHLVIRQPYSFYEVITCRPGEGFQLRDILLENDVDVLEHSGSQMAHKGDLLFARIIEFDHVGLMVGSGSTLIPPASKPSIIHLRSMMRSQKGRLSIDDLQAWDREIRELYFAIDEHLHMPPQLRNTEGDPLCMHALYFEVDSPQYAFDQLKGLASHVDEADLLCEAELDADGQVQEVEFPWLKSGNAKLTELEHTVLGHIHIQGHQLIASVNSKNRADRLKAEIEGRLKGHVRYKATEIQSLMSMLREAKNRPSRQAEEDIAHVNAQPEIQEQIDQMLDAHWENWVHTKLPALGDQTPFEAVQDADGREMVMALLDDLERREQNPMSGIKQQKYIDRARQQLGLC